MKKLGTLMVFLSLHGIIRSDVCVHAPDGQFRKHQSSSCHYVQCIHGKGLSRKCPSGLGILPQFSVGHRNPCVVQQPQCRTRVNTVAEVPSQQRKVQKKAVDTEPGGQQTGQTNRRQYLKELSTPEYQHHASNGFVNFGYQLPNPETQQNNQYQPLEFGANNNFDSSFNYVLDSIQAETSPVISNDQFISYPYDTAQVYMNGDLLTANGHLQGFSNTNQHTPQANNNYNNNNNNNNHGQINHYLRNTGSVQEQNQYQFQPNIPVLHQASGFNGHEQQQQQQQQNVQFTHYQAQPQSPVYEQTVQYGPPTYQQTPVVEQYNQPNIQPNIQQVNTAASQAVYPSQTYNIQQQTSYQQPQQTGLVVSLPNNYQPNTNSYTPGNGDQVVGSSAYQQEVNPVSTLYQTKPVYQPQAAVVQPTPPAQTAYTAAQNTYTAKPKNLSTQQKQQLLQKLIPFLSKLQPTPQTSYQQVNNPSKTDRRRAVLVKILKRLIQAMKQGVLSKPRGSPVRQVNAAPKRTRGRPQQQARNSHKPRQQKRRRGKARRRPYRRRNKGIMAKMASGQGGVNINTRGVNQEDYQDPSEYSDYGEETEDYTSEYDDQQFNNNAVEKQEVPETSEGDGSDDFKIDYNAPGTNAPVTEDSKFRHMRDGIRVPYSKEGRSLFNGGDTGFRPSPTQSSNQHQISQQSVLEHQQQFTANTGKADQTYRAPTQSFTGGQNQVENLEQDFFSDDVPIEYIDKLRKLAVDYFNDEYDVTDQNIQYPDYSTETDIKQQSASYNYQDNNNQLGIADAYDDFRQQTGKLEPQDVLLKSTLPPEPQPGSDIDTISQTGILKTNTPTSSDQLSGSESRQQQATDDGQNPDIQDESERKREKEDIAFQQALTYYSKLLTSLSDFLGDSGVDVEQDGKDVEDISSNTGGTTGLREEKLQNYSYQDLTTEVNVEEYQSNEVAR